MFETVVEVEEKINENSGWHKNKKKNFKKIHKFSFIFFKEKKMKNRKPLQFMYFT